jgi:catechol 1,2-dioxygenase
MTSTEVESATAAASGASATERFQSDKSPFDAVRDVPKDRVDMLAREVLDSIHSTIRRHQVTYAEYNALKAWLIQVGLDGEWPLFLDVFVEHAVEQVATAHRRGNKGAIEGPYYVPGAPERGADASILERDEPGTPLVWEGVIKSVDGTVLAGGKLDVWQDDIQGYYSQFSEGQPQWNLRGIFTVGDDGRFRVHTIKPAPYQIPHDGATGKLIEAAGWHAWRPAHIHVKVSAPGHETLTAQLYFPGDDHNDDDIASAVKPELILDPQPQADGTLLVSYDVVLDPIG